MGKCEGNLSEGSLDTVRVNMKTSVSMQRTALTASSRTAGSVRASARAGVRRSHVLRAQERDTQQQNEFFAKGARTLAAIALAATISVADVPEAQAKKDISGLTPCAKSKPYAKREKQAVKALQKRLKKYEEGSAGASAINDQGFALQYGHTGEILVPTFAFVYFAGIIGYA